jgi:clan AA aspartic protease (TIGR02281 family)
MMKPETRRSIGLLVGIVALMGGGLVAAQYFAGTCADRAKEFYKNGQFGDAVRDLRFASVFLPWRADIHCDLAYALNASRDREASATEAMIASKLAPRDKVIRERCLSLLERVGDLEDQVVTQFDDMLKQWPDDFALKLRAAAGFAEAHQRGRAEALYKECCLHEPKLEGVWLERANLLLYDNKVNTAAAVLQEAIEHLPDSARLHYELGRVFLAQGKRQEALVQLESSAKLDKDSAEDLDSLIVTIRNPANAHYIFVPLQRHQNSFLVDAVLNKTAHARLILDTGAESCHISRAMARAARLDPRKGRVKTYATASDIVQHIAISVPEVTIGGVTEKDIETAVGDMPGDHDGLLGITFLKRFDFTLDTKHNLLILQPRRSKKIAQV